MAFPLLWANVNPGREIRQLQSVGRLRSSSVGPRRNLPADQAGAPGQAAAHRLHEDEVAGPDAAVADRVGERERDRCSRSIRMPINGYDDFAAIETELAPHAVD